MNIVFLKPLIGEPQISPRLPSTMRKAPARQISSCPFCNLQIVCFYKLGNFYNQANGVHFHSKVWLAFSLGLEVTQNVIGACCLRISNVGKACGKFEGGCEAPDDYGRNLHFYKVLLFLG